LRRIFESIPRKWFDSSFKARIKNFKNRLDSSYLKNFGGRLKKFDKNFKKRFSEKERFSRKKKFTTNKMLEKALAYKKFVANKAFTLRNKKKSKRIHAGRRRKLESIKEDEK